MANINVKRQWIKDYENNNISPYVELDSVLMNGRNFKDIYLNDSYNNEEIEQLKERLDELWLYDENTDITIGKVKELEENLIKLRDKTTLKTGSSQPSNVTSGEIGTMYLDTSENKFYICVNTSTTAGHATYEWIQVGGSGNIALVFG